jgi:hypothetical protein
MNINEEGRLAATDAIRRDAGEKREGEKRTKNSKESAIPILQAHVGMLQNQYAYTDTIPGEYISKETRRLLQLLWCNRKCPKPRIYHTAY